MANLIKKIIELFKTNTSGSVIGIDFGSSAIKVVQLKSKNGRAVLETYGSISLGPYDELDVGQTTNLSVDKLSEALNDLLKESNVTTKNAILSIPARASLIFVIELPSSIKENELPDVVPIESRKYIPVPISEVSLDWWIIPSEEQYLGKSSDDSFKNKKEKIKVLVVAIRNDIIDKYKDIIKNTGLLSSSFEMEVFSSIRSSFNRELSSALLFDMGALKTKLSIVEYGVVRDFHTINRGSQDITNNLSKSLGISFSQAEEIKREFGLTGNPADRNIAEAMKLIVDYILSESNSVVLNYEKKYNKTISKIILIGGGILLKDFPALAAKNFKSEIVIGDPFNKINTPAFLDNVLKQAGPEFSVAVGLALRRLQ